MREGGRARRGRKDSKIGVRNKVRGETRWHGGQGEGKRGRE